MASGKYKEAAQAFEKAIEIKQGSYLKASENLKKANVILSCKNIDQADQAK